MSRVSCITKEISQLTEQIYRVRIAPEDGKELQFEGGQYLFLVMSENKKIPLSIASAPEEKDFIELHIRKMAEDSLASEMLSLFSAGEAFDIDAPHGRCYLKSGDDDVVIIAGGTGFSPMKSLVESALARNDKRHLSLYLGAQSSAELYQTSLIETWDVTSNRVDYIPVIGQAEESWEGDVGFPHQVALSNLGHNATECEFFISGSEAMVLNVYKELLDVGVKKNKIHSDILDIKRDSGEQI